MSNLKIDLSKYDNSWYNPGSLIRRTSWYIVGLIFFENPLPFPYVLKRCLLRLFCARVGSGVTIKASVKIKYPWFLKIGSNVWIGEGVWIDNLTMVEIQDNVCISQGVYLLTGNHDYKKATFDLIVKNIVLEEGVWVGARVVLCPGIRLKSHSVITAGSVVDKDAEPYTIYKGNPAIPVRERKIGE